MSSGLGHADGALPGRHTMQIPLRTDAHGGNDGHAALQAHLYGPLHLLHVLEVLPGEARMSVWLGGKRSIIGGVKKKLWMRTVNIFG